jgi:hypothetical protein
MAAQMGFTLFPERFVSTPAGAEVESFIIRDQYAETQAWYESNLAGWTVTEDFDLRNAYEDPDPNALYGYKRLQAGSAGALVFYRGMQTNQMGAATLLVHVTGPQSTIQDTAVQPPAVELSDQSLPQFITHSLVDPSEPSHISYFRSGYAHSYTNDLETCRTMKHYLSDATGSDGTREVQYAPTDGIVTELDGDDVQESDNDYRVVIAPARHPAYSLELFHVDPTDTLSVGDELSAGEEIGRFSSDGMTVGEPAVNVQTPAGRTLVSFYEVMSDEAFAAYQDRGVRSREDLILTEQYRDENPIGCEADGHGTGAYTEQVGGEGLSDVNFVELA